MAYIERSTRDKPLLQRCLDRMHRAASRSAAGCIVASTLLWSAAVGLFWGPVAAAPRAWFEKVEERVLAAARDGEADFLVVLAEQADLQDAARFRSKAERGRWVYTTLRDTAARTQAELLAELRRQGAEHRAFWVVNMIQVRGGLGLVERLARHPSVAEIVENSTLEREMPSVDGIVEQGRGPELAPAVGVEWNVAKIRADAVWAEGFTGQGAVVGGMDTGYEWDHPALRNQYRGFRGAGRPARHDYNWHDAIHSSEFVGCPPDSPEPCDDDGHGTHTMGTAVGDDGIGNQIGVAPGATWIGCRCWEPIRRTHLSYVTECFEWFVAPTDRLGANPDPAMAPHVITNSWICEPDEGCSDPNVLLQTVQNVRAAGIVVAAGAGNSGGNTIHDCSTVSYPPAIYEPSFSVGATTREDGIAAFSSRGPVVVDGSGRMKPDIAAPGQDVRSSVLGGRFVSWSGTSMATPHVSGAVALLVSAVPELAGQVDEIEDILRVTADSLFTEQGCGGDDPLSVPNNVFGAGRLDVFAAYEEAKRRVTGIDDGVPEPDASAAPGVTLSRLLPNRPNPFNPGTRIEFDVAATAHVTLDIHDAAGRRVRRLLSRVYVPGPDAAVWDGRDDRGRDAPSGVYVVRFRAGRVQQSRRIVLLR